MATQKMDVEKFTRENDFHFWRLKMRALLVHQGIEEILRIHKAQSNYAKSKMRMCKMSWTKHTTL